MHASYHNHSTFSDGRSDVADIVQAAIAQGLEEIGVSDHLTLHPVRRISWSMAHDDLPRYVDAVLGAREESKGLIEVRLGLELDWFSGREAILERAISAHPFDYILGSVHFVGEFPIDGSPHRWRDLNDADVERLHRDYWIEMRGMAESRLFDIAAHLDLPKKFGRVPREQPWPEIEAALDALAATGVAVELNTAGWHKPCADAYPSLDILRRCRERGIGTLLSADAHDKAHLNRDFDRGLARLREAGYEELLRFQGRNRRPHPIDQVNSV